MPGELFMLGSSARSVTSVLSFHEKILTCDCFNHEEYVADLLKKALGICTQRSVARFIPLLPKLTIQVNGVSVSFQSLMCVSVPHFLSEVTIHCR